MLHRFSTKRIIGFFLLDWLGTIGLLLAAQTLRFRLGYLPAGFVNLLTALQIEVQGQWEIVDPRDLLDLPVFIVVAIIWPFFLITFSVYDGRHNQTLKSELLNVFMAICVSTTAFAGLLFFSYRDTPRVLVIIFFFLDVAFLFGTRLVLWGYRTVQVGHKKNKLRRAIIIGAGPVGQNAVIQLNKYAWTDLQIMGYLDDEPAKREYRFEGIPVLGTLDQASIIVEQYSVKYAVVALPLRAHKRIIGICNLLQSLSVQVYVIPDLFALSFPNAALDGFGGIPVIDLGHPGIHGLRRLVKRVFDVAAVTTGLLILSPLLLLIALLILLDSPGPIVYKQERIGENGRLFTMFKFRSMRVGADPEVHKMHVARLIKENLSPEQLVGNNHGSLKMEYDPRVTRIGSFLRKTSLDELPQLFNVLRGEMSLVGPRPSLPYEVDLFQDWHKRRFEALPGITGLWQVKGRNLVSFDEMVRMDLEYIEKQSIWLDLRILFQTPWVVITAKGAG
jgi:exopolysaccharide biosynthesis polyprenyl glycosylphosphotransferase